MAKIENIAIAGTSCWKCKVRYSITQQGKKGDAVICPHCGAEGERYQDG